MKFLLRRTAILFKPLIMVVLSFFFEKKYLTGRHFDYGFSGIRWCLSSIWIRNILRLNKTMPFPAALGCSITKVENIEFHPDDLNNFQSPGTYFQNFKGKIYLGRGVYIAPNVGLITANHNLTNLDQHDEGKDIFIGAQSWVGMNSVILPGVILGDQTIVAAGSVVTKSFPEGKVVLAGVPAKVIKSLLE